MFNTNFNTKYYSLNFLNKLIKLFQKLTLQEISKNNKKYITLNDYLLKNYNLTLYAVIDNLINYISINERNDKYYINLNPNTFIINTNLKSNKILQLINYGNLSVQPTKLLTNIWKNINKNLSIYTTIYLINKDSNLWR